MPKLTLKYIGAVIAAERFVDKSLIERMTHDEIYGALNSRGYAWDGTEWRKVGSAVQGEDTLIRVMGAIDAANEATLDIAAALVARGYRIIASSEPHKNANGKEIRRYLTVAKGE